MVYSVRSFTCFEANRFAGLWAAAVDIEEGGGDK